MEGKSEEIPETITKPVVDDAGDRAVGGAFLALQGDASRCAGPIPDLLIVYASDETGNYEIFTLESGDW